MCSARVSGWNAAVMVSLTVFTTCYADQQSVVEPRGSGDTTSREGGHARQSEAPSPAKQTACGICSGLSSKKVEPDASWWQKSANTNALVAAFTFGLLVIGGIQVFFYRKQSKIMEAALNATEKAANAAAATAKLESDRRRPLLLLSELGFGDMGAADFSAMLQSPKIKAVVVNYGGTVAIPKSQSMTILCAARLPKPEEASEREIGTPFPGSIIDPDAGMQLIQAGRPFFSVQQIHAMQAGKEFLWVYGMVRYEDFQGNEYYRRYCYRLYVSESGDQYIIFAQDPNTPREYTQSS
jgi:hypothetical protein